MKKSLQADLMLIFVTLGWGLSYYFVDITMIELNVFTQNAYRFLIAFCTAFLLSYKKLKKPSKTTIKYSFLLGCILFMVYLGATMGVKYTTLTNTGFLCSLTVIFTPILTAFWSRKLPNLKTGLAVMLCFIGIILLTLQDGLSFNITTLKGDLFSIMCAFFYACHLMVTERAVKNKDVSPYQMSVYQFLFCGVLNLAIAFLFENPALPKTGKVWFAILFLSMVCTGMAFIIQAIAQQYTTATHVGVIFSLEPVFAGIVAFFLAGERLHTKAYFGAVLMIISIFIMELPMPWEKKQSLL